MQPKCHKGGLDSEAAQSDEEPESERARSASREDGSVHPDVTKRSDDHG